MKEPILNDRRARLLEILRTYLRENGHSPTVKELEALTISPETPNGFSFGSIQWHLNKLVEDGWITRKKGLGRTIRLVS